MSGFIVLAVLTVVAATLVVPRLQAYVKDTVEQRDLNTYIIYDSLHQVLPDWSAHYTAGDSILYGILGLAFGYLAIKGQWSKAATLAVWLLALTVLKQLINALTILPDPSGLCGQRSYQWGGCNELMPSGHCLLAFFVLFYLWKKQPTWLWTLEAVATAGLAGTTLAIRNHYTIDVVVSFLVAAFMSRYT
jgi:membrane-associated phospholipid phosphatase